MDNHFDWKKYVLYRIKHFSPAVFAATMGVGISAAILYSFPFPAEWLRVLGVIIWGVNLGLFSFASVVFILRFVLFPEQLMLMLDHVGQSVFLGCYPMGLATIINMVDLIFGHRGWMASYIMWWIDVVLSLATAWGVVYYMISNHSRTIETLNATILLPVVSLVVAAATGGLICPNLPQHLQTSTMVISALLWANGELLGLSFIVIYLNRLLLHNLPHRLIIISNFLPVGPLGQGAFAIQNITDACCGILAANGVDPTTVKSVHYLGVSVALVLVGYASFWMFIATTAVLTNRPSVFHMSWWGLTFPIGTYVLAWYKLAEETDFLTFKVVGAIFGVLEVLLALMCFLCMIKGGFLSGTLVDQAKAETSADDDSINITCRFGFQRDKHSCSQNV